MRPELHDRGDDLGRDLREFGDERRGERLLDLRLVLLEAAGALDLEKVLVFFDMYLMPEGMSILAMVAHRLTRILTYAEPPYDVTLYLDDDMYACPGVEPLLGAAPGLTSPLPRSGNGPPPPRALDSPPRRLAGRNKTCAAR